VASWLRLNHRVQSVEDKLFQDIVPLYGEAGDAEQVFFIPDRPGNARRLLLCAQAHPNLDVGSGSIRRICFVPGGRPWLRWHPERLCEHTT